MSNPSELSTKSATGTRLNSFLAQCGLGSRRACEALILAGKVSIDGKTVVDLATRINPEKNLVQVAGKPVTATKKIHLAFNKPAGCLCTRGGGRGDRDIYHYLSAEHRSLFYVGRLDRDTEGLLFLTNDGDWAQKVAHPRSEVRKIYEAEIRGELSRDEARRALSGILDEGESLRFESVRPLRRRSSNRDGFWVEVTIREGKKREIRRLFRALHHPVLYLKRIRIGGVSLGDLPSGRWRPLSEGEIRSFR